MRRIFVSILAAACLFGAPVRAEPFPSKPVRLIVPYTPGGVTDIYARSIADKLSQMWGKTVVVENKPGGGTVIGTQMAASAKPDGHTILLASYGFTSNQLLRAKLPYDPKTLEPVYMLGQSNSMMVINRDLPLKTLDDVIKFAKSKPGAFIVASSGNGSSPHIGAEIFAAQIGAEILHIPYQGTAPAMADLIAGRVHALFDGPSAMQKVRDGELRAIAISSADRHRLAEEVPTFREQGLDFVFGSWFGFFVTGGTPKPVQDKIYKDLEAALADPAVKGVIEQRLQLMPMTQDEFKAFLAAELEKLRPLVEAGKVPMLR